MEKEKKPELSATQKCGDFVQALRYRRMGAMALGLFASLLIGTIIQTIAENVGTAGLMATLSGLSGDELAAQTTALGAKDAVCWVFYRIGTYATAVTGAAMAVAIGHALAAPPLVLFFSLRGGTGDQCAGRFRRPSGGTLCGNHRLRVWKVSIQRDKGGHHRDAAVTIIVGVLCAMFLAPIFKSACDALGTFIGWATNLQPFLMGIVVSAVVGIVLTLPISSAAICAAMGISGGAVLTALGDGGVTIEVWNGLALAGGRGHNRLLHPHARFCHTELS